MKTTLLSLALLGLAAAAARSARAAEASPEITRIPFADPAKPGTLQVTLAVGSITVHGSDSREIEIRSSVPPRQHRRPDGLRVLTTSSGFDVQKHDNVVNIDFSGGLGGAPNHRVDIAVPKNTAVVLNSFSGNIRCRDLDGDVDVHDISGAIDAERMGGGLSVEVQNGKVHAGFRALQPGHCVSVTSLNGEVVLVLPIQAKASLQLRTQNGSILTDFDEKDLTTTTLGSDEGDSHTKVVVVEDRRIPSVGPDRSEELEKPELPEKPEPTEKPEPGSKSGADRNDVYEATREAMRESADAIRDAAREAAQAARDAARGARDGLAEAGIHIPIPPIPPLPPMTGGKTIAGLLHGGGTNIQVTTLNGDVTVRKWSDK